MKRGAFYANYLHFPSFLCENARISIKMCAFSRKCMNMHMFRKTFTRLGNSLVIMLVYANDMQQEITVNFRYMYVWNNAHL